MNTKKILNDIKISKLIARFKKFNTNKKRNNLRKIIGWNNKYISYNTIIDENGEINVMFQIDIFKYTDKEIKELSDLIDK